MKAVKQTIGRTVDRPEGHFRFYLFHGPDVAQSRGLAARLLVGLTANKAPLAAASVSADPAALADEAGALSLFGGKSLIWIEPAGDDIALGVEALLGAGATESPVVAIAGKLGKGSALLKLAEASPVGLAHASYLPDGREAEQMVVELARTFGLKVSPAIAARLANSCGGDQGLVTQELDKFALYIGASPNAPKELEREALDSVGAELEGDFLRVADIALGGDLGGLADELTALSASGNEAIPVVRALHRRLLMLAPARGRMDRGESADAAMASLGKTVFFKDERLVRKLLASWDSESLATAAERVGRLERDLLFTKAPAAEALGQELIAIARRSRENRGKAPTQR